MKVLKKINWFWKNFWGKRYRVIKNNKVEEELLVYGHKIYVTTGDKDKT